MSVRSRLSNVKRQVIDVVGVKPFVRAIEAIPRSHAARILEQIHLTGRLDYPSHEIRMDVQSVYQFSRLRSCLKEPGTVHWLEREFRPRDVFCDVGANVGAYTLLAHALVPTESTVYAFEPSFATFGALCRNIQMNRCGESVLPFPVVLSDQTGIVPFSYYSTTVGAAFHTAGEPLDHSGNKYEPAAVVPTLGYRLDDFLLQFGLQPPTLVKIDVDGLEASVLRGAERTLQHVRSLLVEAQVETAKHHALRKFLGARGFQERALHRSVSDGFANLEFCRVME